MRKTGPVRSLSMGSGWLYLLMVGGLEAIFYLIYRQQLQLSELADDSRLLMLRAERLESLVQEQETRDILSQQTAEDRDLAVGYIALMVRGQRQGKPWLEAWPTMRLSAVGRPQSYHHGTSFSVQRYRRVLARVASLDGKKLESLEFVVYFRQSNLVMVKTLPLNSSKGASRSQ